MPFLNPAIRDTLKSAVQDARTAAEKGAQQALDGLAVGQAKFFPFMSAEQRELRIRLRFRARQLGDVPTLDDRYSLENLIEACGYEHWHRMLFARFLAENNLLVEPEMGVPVSLEECQEFAREQGTDTWTWPAAMPSVCCRRFFDPRIRSWRSDLPPEHAAELQRLLTGLEREVFLGEDALGWSYQYWQAERKGAINDGGGKIGARQLAAVTRLFTKDYMVLFLVHNTLGAWHAGKVMAAKPELFRTAASEEELRRALALPGVDWEYLRFVREEETGWRPAAGSLRAAHPCPGAQSTGSLLRPRSFPGGAATASHRLAEDGRGAFAP